MISLGKNPLQLAAFSLAIVASHISQGVLQYMLHQSVLTNHILKRVGPNRCQLQKADDH